MGRSEVTILKNIMNQFSLILFSVQAFFFSNDENKIFYNNPQMVKCTICKQATISIPPPT